MKKVQYLHPKWTFTLGENGTQLLLTSYAVAVPFTRSMGASTGWSLTPSGGIVYVVLGWILRWCDCVLVHQYMHRTCLNATYCHFSSVACCLLIKSYPTFGASISVSSTSFAWPISEGREQWKTKKSFERIFSSLF